MWLRFLRRESLTKFKKKFIYELLKSCHDPSIFIVSNCKFTLYEESQKKLRLSGRIFKSLNDRI